MIKIGLHLINQHGDYDRIRDTWLEAEVLGVDRIFVVDHFHAQKMDADVLKEGVNFPSAGKNFEATALQAAMAATTSRVEVGCAVHAIGFRNPNLLADMARTIDHISGGRFILGVGAGYMQEEYNDYGYNNFGTAKSRMHDLMNAVPIIKARWQKLNPPPVRKIPLLIATMGENLGMRLVAREADMWNVFGTTEKIRHKLNVFHDICNEVGRDPAEIDIMATCDPQLIPDNDYDLFHRELGFTSLSVMTRGPEFDLTSLKNILAWRDSV
jgi:probable F420-dependent oxidoreductase